MIGTDIEKLQSLINKLETAKKEEEEEKEKKEKSASTNSENIVEENITVEENVMNSVKNE